MDVKVQPGVYVVAVSGGVDSIVMLDLLCSQPDVKLVVAHFDHGIRVDSDQDRLHVQSLARQYGLPFVHHEGRLGADASEDQARKARYTFLHQVREASGALSIITAHHHDDAVETALINMIRGTNRIGLTALASKKHIYRPMLHLSKRDIIAYAQDQGLVWREDSTNIDTKYLRNYIRHKVMPNASEDDRQKLREILLTMRRVNTELDEQITHFLHVQPAVDVIDRDQFIQLPHAVAREILAAWLRKHGLRDFDQKTLERVVAACKTFRIGGVVDVAKGYTLQISRTKLALKCPDR